MSCRCGATWTGARVEHCPVTGCHQTFTSTSSGDAHRTGDHAVSTGPNRRRCLTVDEMLVKGMAQNSRGHWTTGPGSGFFGGVHPSYARDAGPEDVVFGPTVEDRSAVEGGAGGLVQPSSVRASTQYDSEVG